MIKDFFIGLGVVILVIWGVTGLACIMLFLTTPLAYHWWNIWHWIAIVPAAGFLLWFIGKSLKGIGESVRKGNW